MVFCFECAACGDLRCICAFLLVPPYLTPKFTVLSIAILHLARQVLGRDGLHPMFV